VFDRRFLIEESFDTVRAEIVALLDRTAAACPGLDYELHDRLVVHPSQAPLDSPLVAALDRAIASVVGRVPAIVASPGTYDQRHVDRIGGVGHCVAYGPGRLELAHQPDEYCDVDELIAATKVLALAILALAGPRE
jgi:succinyl-diaminopimelate desuccinylase